MSISRPAGTPSLSLAAALLVLSAAAAGCTSEASGSAAGATPSRAPDPSPTMTLPDTPGTLPPGTYALEIDGVQQKALVQLPAGYDVKDARVVAPVQDVPESEWHALSVWEIAGVFPHPCDGRNRTAALVGPTVADLADALAAQPLRAASDPVPVRLSGYEGMYVELSVPDGIDVDTCAGSRFLSWTDSYGGRRWQQGAGQVDRVWILDVDGRRLVVDATHMPGASEQQVAALTEMVDTITFTAAT